MKHKPLLWLALTLSVLLGATALRAGTHYWNGGGSTEYWNNPANWNGNLPLIGEAAPVIVIFTNTFNGKPTTNNIPGLVIDSLQFHGTNLPPMSIHSFSGGSIIIRGGNSATNLWFKSDDYVIESDLPVTFTGTNYCYVNGGQSGYIYGVIAGTGDITWDGGGGITYAGGSPNTFSGTTHVRSASFHLSKTAGVNAIAGPLVLEPGSSLFEARLEADEQISDSAPVTIRDNRQLYSSGWDETIGSLILSNGAVTLTTGTLTLKGSVTSLGNDYIYNIISLGGATRTFFVAPTASLGIYSPMVNGGATAGVNFNGGTVNLYGTNAFTGAMQITNATIFVYNNFAFGSTAGGTFVDSNSVIVLQSKNVVGESLSLAGRVDCFGTNFWTGNVTMLPGGTFNCIGGHELTLSGVVSGGGKLTKDGLGKLVLAGSAANTYTGGTELKQGYLVLSKTNATAIPGSLRFVGSDHFRQVDLVFPNQIANTSAVTMTDGCFLRLNNNSESIGSLAGEFGPVGSTMQVDLGTGVLTNGTDNTSTTYAGSIVGTGPLSLVKTGTGIFTFTGSSTASGTNVVNQGTLLVNGTCTGPVIVSSPGRLGGIGKVGHATSNSGNVIPGYLSPGSLSTGNLALNNTTTLYFVRLDTATNDSLNVSGSVAINHAQLVPSATYGGYVGKKFTIIANDGADAVTGTFNGLPEGGTIAIGSQEYQISYHGGTGNDVVLTQTAAPFVMELRNLAKQGNGTMIITGAGPAGTTYTVQATTLLSPANWQNIGTATAGADDLFSFTDNNAPSFPSRFYRLRLP